MKAGRSQVARRRSEIARRISEFVRAHGVRADVAAAIVDLVERGILPLPMILPCPHCGAQHIDTAHTRKKWHRTHRCLFCQREWTPSTLFTVGVRELKAL